MPRAALASRGPPPTDGGRLPGPGCTNAFSAARSDSSYEEHYHRQIRRGDAAHPAGLAEVGGTNARQLFPRFDAELWHGGVVEMQRDRLRFQALKSLHFGGLPIDVAGVLGLQEHLLRHVRSKLAE